MIRFTIILKKRELDSELVKLHNALEELKSAILESMIPKSVIRKMRKAGISGARAGSRLRRIMNKKTKED